MIVLKDVTKLFGKKPILDHVSLQINPGEFVCIVGPSGAGKTTLLQLLIGAERLTEGAIEVDGVDLKNLPKPVMQLYRRRVGMIFQEGRLILSRTVAENVAFPLEACGWDDAAIRQRVTEVLQLLHLTDLAQALPADLSSGENAKVAIARAIIHEPMIILADEPTAHLDQEQAKEVLRILRQLHQAGATVLLATHDLPLAQSFENRMVEIRNGHVSEVQQAGSGAQATKHEILSRTPTVAEEETKRKIKITMIHS